jgi:hypothetical protein
VAEGHSPWLPLLVEPPLPLEEVEPPLPLLEEVELPLLEEVEPPLPLEEVEPSPSSPSFPPQWITNKAAKANPNDPMVLDMATIVTGQKGRRPAVL